MVLFFRALSAYHSMSFFEYTLNSMINSKQIAGFKAASAALIIIIVLKYLLNDSGKSAWHVKTVTIVLSNPCLIWALEKRMKVEENTRAAPF